MIFGVRFKTFTVDPTVYLPYLLEKISEHGGRVFRSKLATGQGIDASIAQAANIIGLSEEDERVWAVVNATGLSAREMVGDQDLYPIRGQTVRVKGIADHVSTKLGSTKTDVAAAMPRPSSGCTVVGVTVEPDVWDTTVEDMCVPLLLDRGKALAPELLNEHGHHEVLKVGVGLRPGRKGGARVELEKRKSGLLIAHAYGHAGAG